MSDIEAPEEIAVLKKEVHIRILILLSLLPELYFLYLLLVVHDELEKEHNQLTTRNLKYVAAIIFLATNPFCYIGLCMVPIQHPEPINTVMLLSSPLLIPNQFTDILKKYNTDQELMTVLNTLLLEREQWKNKYQMCQEKLAAAASH